MWFSRRVRNWGLSDSKISWQSSKISAKVSWFCVIIIVSPFGMWFMVSSQLHYITNREEIFIFSNKKMPYLCGLWRFANAYKNSKKKGDKKCVFLSCLRIVVRKKEHRIVSLTKMFFWKVSGQFSIKKNHKYLFRINMCSFISCVKMDAYPDQHGPERKMIPALYF